MRKTLKILPLVFLFLFIKTGIDAQQKQYKFSHITVANGLPENSVNVIIQDYLGFLWFGTQNGLIRYDGYKLLTFKPDKNNTRSLSQEGILSIYEDKNKTLWIGTWYGLNRYDRNSNDFTVFLPDPKETGRSFTSVNCITSIYEDKRGILWIITGNRKLIKFNKSTCKFDFLQDLFGNAPNLNSTMLVLLKNDLRIPFRLRKYPFYEDEGNIFWIGTLNGLHSYNAENGIIRNYYYEPNNQNTISNNHITQIINEDKEGLWIGTFGGGLNYLDKKNGKFTYFVHKPKDKNSILNDSIVGLYYDCKGILWISTTKGLDCYNKKNNTFTHYIYDPKNQSGISDNICIPIYEDPSKDEIWFLTNGAGLDIFDRKMKIFNHARPDPDNNESISGFGVDCIFRDSSGVLWIGTSWAGVNKLKEWSFLNFSHMQHEIGNSSGLLTNFIYSLLESKYQKDLYWIGTPNGLNKYNKKNNTFGNYQFKAEKNSIGGNNVSGLLEDKEGNLWIACYGAGLNKLDIRSDKFTIYKNNSNDSTSISHNDAQVIFGDRDGNIWVGTWGGGLNKFNKKTGKFKRYKHIEGDPYSLDNNSVICIYEDSKATLWVGTNWGGLNKYIPEKDGFFSYLNPDKFIQCVSSIYEDKKGRFWVGTYKYGLHLFDREKGTSTLYSEKDGLLNNSISGIQEDNDGNLWLFTDRGICKFNPDKITFKNYDIGFGIDFKGYSRSGCNLKNSQGEMYVGSSNGIFYFDPEKVFDNPYPPRVALTDIKIHDRNLSDFENLSEYRNVSVLNEITLYHWQNTLSVEFSALHFNIPEKNTYKYYLENFDKNWRDAGYNHIVNYTNLDPGEYVFHVIAANNDGVWNLNPTKIKIIITPPFWRTVWFRVLILVLFAALIIVWYKLRIRSLKKQKKELEIQVDIRTKKINEQKADLEIKNEEIRSVNNELQDMNDLIGEQNTELKTLNEDLSLKNNQIAQQNEALKYLVNEKNEFLGMIAHDLRNPLFAILGSVDLLKRNLSDKDLEYEKNMQDLQRIKTASIRMKRFIEDILQISSIESSKITLLPENTNYNALIKDVVEFYKRIADEKSINLIFEGKCEELELVIDGARIIQVLENLLSNAIKFTPPGGKIKVWCEQREDKLFTFVEDTGVGLYPDEIKFLFKGSKKLSSKPTAGESSTGLGLLIVKHIVELHSGEVFAESEKNKGTKIYFSLKK